MAMLSFVSCGGDDCTVADWLGTYRGEDCDRTSGDNVITETEGNSGQIDVQIGNDAFALTFEG